MTMDNPEEQDSQEKHKQVNQVDDEVNDSEELDVAEGDDVRGHGFRAF